MDDGGNAAAGPAWEHGSGLFPCMSSAAASIITGVALVATRYVVMQADGLTVATLRYCVAATCLLPLAAVFYGFKVAKNDFFSIAMLGILYFCVFPWCISTAMQFTTASSGAIVLACTPAVTLVLATLWGSEIWTARKWAGVILAILGAAIAIGGTAAELSATGWLGHVLMILATVCGAGYAVFSKPYLSKYPPVIVTAIAMGAGAATLVALWLIWDAPPKMPHLNGMGWLVILYIGTVGGALSFFLYAWALGRTAPTATMILLPLNPVAAIISGVIFLGEPLNPGLFIGLAFVVIGIVLVVKTRHGTRSRVVVEAKVTHEVPPA